MPTRSNMLTTSYTKVWSKVWGAFRLTGLKETSETVVETWVYDRALDPGASDDRALDPGASDTVTAVKPMKAKKAMKAAMKAMKKVPKAGNKAKKAMKKKAGQK